MNNPVPQKRPDGSIVVQVNVSTIAAIRRARANGETITLESGAGQHCATFLVKDDGKHFSLLIADRLYILHHDAVDDVMYLVPAGLEDLQANRDRYLALLKHKEAKIREYFQAADSFDSDDSTYPRPC